ncbi:hypothetical protein BDV37DRAFT_209628 [Aspergillus pseudonomiae]|uniref:Uncharacterized protein n=1 Tax=Aspergillus pseudonomiae TaxID=1506151 RepID=A0A5N7D1Q6_9EURO|nr:uncharacterized protein BDV37DRAFT_209628 [Aspergillus pseudonomiae]KAE8400350.1 hypothetical protein BDV37DRAFT_209628 [Aspergillus pseudonomiae]
MSRNITRGFQTASSTFIRYAGSQLEELVTTNGPDGPAWSHMTDTVCHEIEKADSRITVADIQGSRAHKSSKDREDKENVITVGLQTNSGTRIGSLHVHLNGTFKFFASRAGREGGYADKIAQANIPGYISSMEEREE